MFKSIKEKIVSREDWSTARKKYISAHPFCEICGYLPTGKLSVPNEVHHIIPRHIDASKTTDQDNLITLCRKDDCHLRFGHFGNYRKCWNRNVRTIFSQSGERMMEEEKMFRKLNIKKPIIRSVIDVVVDFFKNIGGKLC